MEKEEDIPQNAVVVPSGCLSGTLKWLVENI